MLECKLKSKVNVVWPLKFVSSSKRGGGRAHAARAPCNVVSEERQRGAGFHLLMAQLGTFLPTLPFFFSSLSHLTPRPSGLCATRTAKTPE